MEKEPTDIEEMEMPCMCDCGNWFDLNDGYTSKVKKNIVVCPDCHHIESANDDIEVEIENIEFEMECGGIGKREGKKKIKELKSKIKALLCN